MPFGQPDEGFEEALAVSRQRRVELEPLRAAGASALIQKVIDPSLLEYQRLMHPWIAVPSMGPLRNNVGKLYLCTRTLEYGKKKSTVCIERGSHSKHRFKIGKQYFRIEIPEYDD